MATGSVKLTERERVPSGKIYYGDREVAMSGLRTRDFYAMQLPVFIPTAQQRWVEGGIDFGECWSKIYCLVFNLRPGGGGGHFGPPCGFSRITRKRKGAA